MCHRNTPFPHTPYIQFYNLIIAQIQKMLHEKADRQKWNFGKYRNNPGKYRIWLLFQENYIILKNEMPKIGAKIGTNSI